MEAPPPDASPALIEEPAVEDGALADDGAGVDGAPATDDAPATDGARMDGTLAADGARVDDGAQADGAPADDGARTKGALATNDAPASDGALADGALADGARLDDGARTNDTPATDDAPAADGSPADNGACVDGTPAADDAPVADGACMYGALAADGVRVDDGARADGAPVATAGDDAPAADGSPTDDGTNADGSTPADDVACTTGAPAMDDAPAADGCPVKDGARADGFVPAADDDAPVDDESSPAAEEVIELVEEIEPRDGSLRLGWRDGHGSFLMNIGVGAFRADRSADLEDESSAEEREYVNGFEIKHGGKHVCVIARRLGKGAMGTVYLGQQPDGSQFAVKAVSADKSGAERAEMEGQFALEVSIGFALGRHPLIATVIGMAMPLPGTETTAKGLLLFCDLVDRGDLEEAMSTKAAVAKSQPDYAGELWDATLWSVASITLQIFLGFDHVHNRGILHQVRNLELLVRLGSRVVGVGG